ncbi:MULTISPECIES: hypothetical protein [Lactobacillus]|uniref:hypothetical protein n=1 Tax=Lactobacillus TaxID=1578 RepID=UPI001E41C510|nr:MULTISPECIES: hypothetical protein [Lactobacillus]
MNVAPASDEDSENHELSWIKKKIENGKGTSVDKVMVGEPELIGKETKITKSDLNIQAGHLLGKFSGVLQNIEKYLGTDQNIDNIMTYPQFKRANESSKEYSGQSKVIFGIIEILVSTMKQKLFLQILMTIFRLVLDFELFQLERMKKTIANM